MVADLGGALRATNGLELLERHFRLYPDSLFPKGMGELEFLGVKVKSLCALRVAVELVSKYGYP